MRSEDWEISSLDQFLWWSWKTQKAGRRIWKEFIDHSTKLAVWKKNLHLTLSIKEMKPLKYTQFTHSQCTIEWCLVYSLLCAANTAVYAQKTLITCPPSLYPPVTTFPSSQPWAMLFSHTKELSNEIHCNTVESWKQAKWEKTVITGQYNSLVSFIGNVQNTER